MSKKTLPKADPKNISEKFIEQFYSVQAVFTDESGQKLDVPESGFLGLLATGYKGLALLRKKRGHTHVYSKFTKGKKLVKRNPKKGNRPVSKLK
jgi:hypothetical protein